MDYLAVAIAWFIAGLSIMSCVCASRMNNEGMERFNEGYKIGLEDGKRMKGEKNETERD